jgi:hypothetical protein
MQKKSVHRPSSDRVLRFLLQWVGIVSLFALVAVFMPYEWMDGIHRATGMGSLPSQPIVGYLARSLSMFYALMGGLLLLCSFDIPRYWIVLCYLSLAFVFFGVVVLGIDYLEGMPEYWRRLEGPFVIGYGIAMLVLVLRSKQKVHADGV